MPQEPNDPLQGLVRGLVDGLEQSLGGLNLGSLGGFGDDETDQRRDGSRPDERRRADRRTPMLNRFGRDLTAEARAGRPDPVIGRDDEVAQIGRAHV